VLVARAVGAHVHLPALPAQVLPAGDPLPWQEPYERWVDTVEALRRATDGSSVS
jgi:hypothetical protein